MKKEKFNILVLDGGGSKGVYTLGILNELEKKLGSTLDNHFNLIYGTSTGSIIAALLALGKPVKEIKKLYFELIPEIMSQRNKTKKSKKLNELGNKIFGDLMFTDFKTDVGIVALNYDTQNPLIFKSNINQAHGMQQSFLPGFGCTISAAIQASSSAFPIFDFKIINTKNQGQINAIDGGFIANNSTLFALIDADKTFKIQKENIKVISIGTGKFVEKPMKGFVKYLKYFKITKFIERILLSSTNTNVILSKLLYKDIEIVRVNDTFNEPEYGTNMTEKNINKLEKLYQLGRTSYANKEKELNNIFEKPAGNNV
jgi:patatin-like phospholipase/acyl hydrolase